MKRLDKNFEHYFDVYYDEKTEKYYRAANDQRNYLNKYEILGMLTEYKRFKSLNLFLGGILNGNKSSDR